MLQTARVIFWNNGARWGVEPGYRRNANGLHGVCARVHPGGRVNDFAGSNQ
jgi:hypothetical protein